MKKTNLLILLSLSILSITYSQSSSQKLVFGAVIAEDGYPVSKTFITIRKGNTIISGTTTNKDGLFELYMNENDELHFSHLSYDNTIRSYDELMEYPIVEVQTTKHTFETPMCLRIFRIVSTMSSKDQSKRFSNICIASFAASI